MEIELDGVTYKIGTISARDQFHIVRRLAPIFSGLVAQQSNAAQDALPFIASAISKLSDDDGDYVLFGLLKVVTRKLDNGLGWAPVSKDKVMMYSDINMGQMLRLAWNVLSHNMSGFFAALPSDLQEVAQKASGQLPG